LWSSPLTYFTLCEQVCTSGGTSSPVHSSSLRVPTKSNAWHSVICTQP
jgi:hypothetical protein